MTAKGGGVKASSVFGAISGASGIAGAASSITGVGAVAGIPLGVISGITGGVSTILKIFGAGMPKHELDRLRKMHKEHNEHLEGKRILPIKKVHNDVKYLTKINNKYGGSLGKKLAGIGLITTGLLGGAGSAFRGEKEGVIGAIPLIAGGTALLKGGMFPRLSKEGKQFIKEHPDIAVRMLKEAHQTHLKGGSFKSKLLTGLSVAGLSASAGAMAFREYLIRNPTQIAKIAGMAAQHALGGSIKSGGKVKLKIGTKDQVGAGLAYKTKSGLIKKDLVFNKKRNKWVSKKQSENAHRMIKAGILKPIRR